MSKTTETTKRDKVLCDGDLPSTAVQAARERRLVAWDIETSGLSWKNDVIATCQIFIPGSGIFIVKVTDSPQRNMAKILEDSSVKKIFHHALFDLRFMSHHWNVSARNIACTKIASKILSPSREKHSLQDLLSLHLGVSIHKDLQTSNWLAKELTDAQLTYAANDVLYLTHLLDALLLELQKERLLDLINASFSYIPCRVALDIRGSGDVFTY